jgi:hypothetical protein
VETQEPYKEWSGINQPPEIYFPDNTKSMKDRYVNIIGIIAGVLLVMYLLILIFTKRDKRVDSDVIKQKIDSLDKVNEKLIIKQNELDSITQEYNAKIEEIDGKINDIKRRKVIVREYYNSEIDKTKQFTVNQADSFLKNRYNY